MKITLLKMNDLFNNMQTINLSALSEDTYIVYVLKRLFRSDNVIIDIYKDDISENTKIVSGKVLVPNSVICTYNDNMGALSRIECLDVDGVRQPITSQNVHKYYLQFTSETEGENWVDNI